MCDLGIIWGFLWGCTWIYSDIRDNIWDGDVNVYAIIHSFSTFYLWICFILTDWGEDWCQVPVLQGLFKSDREQRCNVRKKRQCHKNKDGIQTSVQRIQHFTQKPCWSRADRLPDANTTCFCKASTAVRRLAMALKTPQNLVGSFLLELLITTDLLLGRSVMCLTGDPP